MALVNHLIKLGESEALNRVTIKNPKNDSAPINADPTISLAIHP